MKVGDRVYHGESRVRGTVTSMTKSGKSAWVQWDDQSYSTRYQCRYLALIK